MKITGFVTPEEAIHTERKNIVLDDLLHLKKMSLKENSTSELRMSVVILRRLLIEGTLIDVLRAVNLSSGFKLHVVKTHGASHRPQSVTSSCRRGIGILPWATTINFGRSEFQTIIPGIKEEFFTGPGYTIQECSIQEYLSAPIITKGVKDIPREYFIKYMANKRGGVHIDARRDKKHDAKYRILDQIGYPAKFQLGEYSGSVITSSGRHGTLFSTIEAMIDEISLSNSIQVLLTTHQAAP